MCSLYVELLVCSVIQILSDCFVVSGLPYLCEANCQNYGVCVVQDQTHMIYECVCPPNAAGTHCEKLVEQSYIARITYAKRDPVVDVYLQVHSNKAEFEDHYFGSLPPLDPATGIGQHQMNFRSFVYPIYRILIDTRFREGYSEKESEWFLKSIQIENQGTLENVEYDVSAGVWFRESEGWRRDWPRCFEPYHGAVNPCHNVSCQNGATCVDAGNSHYCDCFDEQHIRPSYPDFGRDCPYKTGRFYICRCAPGYIGNHCEIVKHVKMKVSLKAGGGCADNPCSSGGYCSEKGGSINCICLAGYTGTKCESDIDECASGPCRNLGACVNHLNSFTCSCPAGYKGTACEQDINECGSNPCKHRAFCVDKIAAYECQCKPGWTGVHCEIGSDKCASNPCVRGTCDNLEYQFSCRCPIGYKGTKCEKVSLHPKMCNNPSIYLPEDSVPRGQGKLFLRFVSEEALIDPAYHFIAQDDVVEFTVEFPQWNGTSCHNNNNNNNSGEYLAKILWRYGGGGRPKQELGHDTCYVGSQPVDQLGRIICARHKFDHTYYRILGYNPDMRIMRLLLSAKFYDRRGDLAQTDEICLPIVFKRNEKPPGWGNFSWQHADLKESVFSKRIFSAAEKSMIYSRGYRLTLTLTIHVPWMGVPLKIWVATVAILAGKLATF